MIDWEAKETHQNPMGRHGRGPSAKPSQAPQPPTPPKPRPEGLAGKCTDRALAIGNRQWPSTILPTGQCNVTNRSGALTTVPEVMGALRSALTGVAPGDPKWVEFGQWILTIRFGTTAQAKTTIEAVSLGASKGRWSMIMDKVGYPTKNVTTTPKRCRIVGTMDNPLFGDINAGPSDVPKRRCSTISRFGPPAGSQSIWAI